MPRAFLSFVAALAASLLAISTASASVINLAGSGGLEDSYSFSVDGINLTVTAATFNNSGEILGDAKIGQYSNGLGVTSSYHDDHYVDGKNGNDVLIFEFEKAVKFDSVTFAYNDRNDEFTFFFAADEIQGLELISNNVDLPGGSNFYATYVFQQEWISTLFGIGAYDSDDEFKVKKIAVTPTLSVVPVPPALPLFISGFFALRWLGYRRQPRSSRH
jgi:hypothetical protein